MEDKSKYTKIYLDELIVKDKMIFGDWGEPPKERISASQINKALKDASAFSKFIDKQNRLLANKLKEQQEKLTIDIIMLIKGNYFENYDSYKEWVISKNVEIKKSINKPNDFMISYEYKAAIPLLNKKIFDYIRKNYGGVK